MTGVTSRGVVAFGVLAALAILISVGCVTADDGWKGGRVTWFDVQDNDLTTANCHLRWDQISTGRDVGAFSDTGSLFSSSCGMCVEIRCQPAGFKDGYGSWMDRNNACRDPAKSVFVTIADACPCQYPNNEHSNKRWCCGDDSSREHIDITRDVFNTLADLGQGVIGAQWRVVDCSQVKQGGGYYPSDSQPQPAAAPASSGQSNNGGNSGQSNNGGSSQFQGPSGGLFRNWANNNNNNNGGGNAGSSGPAFPRLSGLLPKLFGN